MKVRNDMEEDGLSEQLENAGYLRLRVVMSPNAK